MMVQLISVDKKAPVFFQTFAWKKIILDKISVFRMVFCSKFSKTCFIGPIVNKSENSEIRPEPRQCDTVLPYYIYFHVDNI